MNLVASVCLYECALLFELFDLRQCQTGWARQGPGEGTGDWSC